LTENPGSNRKLGDRGRSEAPGEQATVRCREGSTVDHAYLDAVPKWFRTYYKISLQTNGVVILVLGGVVLLAAIAWLFE
jgi:hypothetical protein